MGQLDMQTVLARIDELLAKTTPGSEGVTHQLVAEVMHGTLTLSELVYGPNSHPARALFDGTKRAADEKSGLPHHNVVRWVWPVAIGILKTMRTDVEAGLVSSLRRQGMGEAIADMLALAKDVLSDNALNVAAVLAAAAYEETIRRMGAMLAGVDDRRKLSEVLIALKAAKALEGAPYTTAQGYLKFRNDALHADWEKLDGPTTSSLIAFTEGLVLKHFS